MIDTLTTAVIWSIPVLVLWLGYKVGKMAWKRRRWYRRQE